MPSVGKKEQRILNSIARKKLKDVQAITEIQKAQQKIDTITNGTPRLYDTPEQLESLIMEYFEDVKTNKEHPTITGLALKLGIDRQTLINYNKRDGFVGILNKAREMILKYTEQMLISKDKFTPGQIFYLKNNYKQDYQDKIEIDNKHSGSVSLVELSSLADNLDLNVIEGELLENESLPEE